MTLQELRYAVTVARERHFGRAAEKCFVSQPSLSVAIKNLEDELGVTLFERTKSEVVITSIGTQILAQAEKVLDEAARIKLLAAGGKDQLQGSIKVGIIHTVAPYLLPDLVATLRDVAPNMPLDIEENMTQHLERMLREAQIDIAIFALPFAAPGIEVLPVYDERFEVIVPSKHPWAKRKSVTAHELGEENLLLLSAGHCFRDQVLDACARFTRFADVGRQGNSLETLRSMVASGLGITVLPATALIERHRSPLVKRVPFASPIPKRRIALAHRQGFYRPRAIEAIADTLRKLNLPIQPV